MIMTVTGPCLASEMSGVISFHEHLFVKSSPLFPPKDSMQVTTTIPWHGINSSLLFVCMLRTQKGCETHVDGSTFRKAWPSSSSWLREQKTRAGDKMHSDRRLILGQTWPTFRWTSSAG